MATVEKSVVLIKLGSPEEATFFPVGAVVHSINYGSGEVALLLPDGTEAGSNPRVRTVSVDVPDAPAAEPSKPE